MFRSAWHWGNASTSQPRYEYARFYGVQSRHHCGTKISIRRLDQPRNFAEPRVKPAPSFTRFRDVWDSCKKWLNSEVSVIQYIPQMQKNVQIKIKNVKKRKNVTKIKKTSVNVIKNVSSSQRSSTPRLMPKKWFSWQLGICHSVQFCRNCRRFRLAVKSSILCNSWSLTF